jgi:hypothetical protein
MRSFEKMVLDFIDILEKLEINYVIIGELQLAHGEIHGLREIST